MKPCGIIIPTSMEAEILVRSMSERTEVKVQNKIYYGGFLNERPVILCLCGIGKTNVAHGTTLLIERFNPASVCVIGVAGAYPSSRLRIGDIAVAEKEIYGDEGLLLSSGFGGMEDICLPLAAVYGKSYYNEFPLQIPEQFKKLRHRGTFVTVSSCTGTLKRGMEIEQKYGALCENMEGASIAHICLMNSIPVMEIRGISNIIENRASKFLDRSAVMRAAENVQEFFLDRLFN